MTLPLPKFTWPRHDASAQEVLGWAIDEFGSGLAICTSFQASGSVILDMAARLVGGDINVFSIDTGRLHEETYQLISQIRQRYGIVIELVPPDADELGRMLTLHGPNLFYESPAKRKLCCELRKVRPLQRRLATLDAWVTGLRRDQDGARERTEPVAIDEEHGGIVKLAPLAGWSNEQVFAYARQHDVPLHPLYAQGYPSIGCQPCTRKVEPGEDSRAGAVVVGERRRQGVWNALGHARPNAAGGGRVAGSSSASPPAVCRQVSAGSAGSMMRNGI